MATAVSLIAPNEVKSALRSQLLTGIAVATTHTEIASGQTENFLRRFLESSCGTTIAPTRRIYVNRTCPLPATLQAVAAECGFEFVFLDIDPVDDVYVRYGSSKPASIPRLGLTAGPNTMFFRIMREAAADTNNTILLLETDCKFGEAWLERLAAYVAAAGNFWIAGALYDGHEIMGNHPLIMTHINGVALYRVGCDDFQKMLNDIEQFIEWKVKHGQPHMPYDMAIRECINTKCDSAAKTDRTNWIHWRYVNRCVVPTQLIVNASCKEDAIIPEKDLKALYNYAILHQK